MAQTDIIQDIMERVAEQLGERADPEALKRIEASIRQDWGGDRPYIARLGEDARAAISARNAAILRDVRKGEAVALIARRYHISRKRVYQIIRDGAEGCEGFALSA